MNTELQRERTPQDVELPEACLGCGGAVIARFTPSGALAVCLACHTITRLGVARVPNGVEVGHLPGAFA